MTEKPPAFVVVDRRKFTSDGALREGFEPEQRVTPEPASLRPLDSPGSAALPSVAASQGTASPGKVVTMPPRTPEAREDETGAADDLREEDLAGALDGTSGLPGMRYEPEDGFADEAGGGLGTEFGAEPIGESRTPAETAEQDAAYRQTSRELDALLRQQNPGAQQPGAVSFDHVIQSFYLSAIMAMGAGTEPGQKPRIDILGARQSIDMLALLEEKTRGNLTPQEGELLKGIMFELRMMFLELTNAISRQATAGPPPGGRPGGLR